MPHFNCNCDHGGPPDTEAAASGVVFMRCNVFVEESCHDSNTTDAILFRWSYMFRSSHLVILRETRDADIAGGRCARWRVMNSNLVSTIFLPQKPQNDSPSMIYLEPQHAKTHMPQYPMSWQAIVYHLSWLEPLFHKMRISMHRMHRLKITKNKDNVVYLQ